MELISTMNQVDLHNRLAAEIVDLCRRPLDAGGCPGDILMLLETVMAVVVSCMAKPGHDDIVVDGLCQDVKMRIAENRASKARLAVCETAGEA